MAKLPINIIQYGVYGTNQAMKKANEIESYHFGEIIFMRHDPEVVIISHCVVINQMQSYTHERDTDEEILKRLIYLYKVKEKLSQGP